ncbi:hypothetical protein DXG01_002160 [Tephrocybe rancida]|nr:hypothetical protein DXG01_002160 [Tephrocybe rancida]
MGPEYLSTVIPRSKGNPLYVPRWGRHLDSATMEHIMQQMHRIRDLEFPHECGAHTCNAHEIISKLMAPTPSLESFDLRTCVRPDSVRCLPDHALSDTTSQIRTIRLKGWMVPVTFVALGGLTDLTVEHLDKPGGPGISELLNVLRLALNLEHLVLHNGFCGTSQTHDPVDAVHLDHLQSLKIMSNAFTSILTLYSYIDHPITTCLLFSNRTVEHGAWTQSSESLSALATSLSTRFTVGSAYIQGVKNRLNLSFWEVQNDDGTDGEPHIVVEVPHRSWYPTPDIYMKEFALGLQLGGLQCLTVDGDEDLRGACCPLFGRLEYLTTVCIHSSGPYLISALATEKAEHGATEGPDGNGALGFRALHTLILQGWVFDEGSVGSIQASLGLRASKGAKLQILRVLEGTWMGITPAWALDWIRPWVEKIEVDIDDLGDLDMVGNAYEAKETDTESTSSTEDEDAGPIRKCICGQGEEWVATEQLFDVYSDDETDSDSDRNF